MRETKNDARGVYMRKILLMFTILTVLLVSCGSDVNEQEIPLNDMEQMPCHEMPDGTMMGDCDEVVEETVDGTTEDLDEELSGLNDLDSELDMSELDDLDAELSDFDW